jgi:hypothetical protein
MTPLRLTYVLRAADSSIGTHILHRVPSTAGPRVAQARASPELDTQRKPKETVSSSKKCIGGVNLPVFAAIRRAQALTGDILLIARQSLVFHGIENEWFGKLNCLSTAYA